MNNYIVNLNYQRKLDTLGGKFSTDFDFIHNSQSSLSASNTRYFFQNISPNTAFKIEDLNNETSSSYNSYVFRADYTKPLGKTLKMELGGKVSITKVDNNFEAMLNDTNDLTKTNHFIYNENINALYGSLNKSFGEKTSLRLGLRMENANLKGEQQIDRISFTQSYTNLFPNLSLSHQFSPKYQSTFTYSMRISRPTYDNLNPFLSKSVRAHMRPRRLFEHCDRLELPVTRQPSTTVLGLLSVKPLGRKLILKFLPTVAAPVNVVDGAPLFG